MRFCKINQKAFQNYFRIIITPTYFKICRWQQFRDNFIGILQFSKQIFDSLPDIYKDNHFYIFQSL